MNTVTESTGDLESEVTVIRLEIGLRLDTVSEADQSGNAAAYSS